MKTISVILFIIIVLCNTVPHAIAELKLYLRKKKKIRDKRKEDDEQ